jgi:hypothetical protein
MMYRKDILEIQFSILYKNERCLKLKRCFLKGNSSEGGGS